MDIQFLQRQCLKTVLDFYINAFHLMITQQELKAGRQTVPLKIKKVFELFNQNCGLALIPNDLLSIDETLHPIRNRVSLKANKPPKYGLLFKSINGARYPYSFVSAPYCGKPKSEPTEEYKQGIFEVTKHIKKLSKYTSLKGQNISFDRPDKSIPLADWLVCWLQSKRTS